MKIQNNVPAMGANRYLGNNNAALSGNFEKLASGYCINRAGDNAAGLTISEKMRSQIKNLDSANKNSIDGSSLVEVAEGAMGEVHSMLNRMAELATQSANGVYSTGERSKMQSEVAQLCAEINRISDSTMFNGIALLGGQDQAGNTHQLPSTPLDSNAGFIDTGGVSISVGGAVEHGTIQIDLASSTKVGEASVTASFADITTPEDVTSGAITYTVTMGPGAVITQSHFDAAMSSALKGADPETIETYSNYHLSLNGKFSSSASTPVTDASPFLASTPFSETVTDENVIKLHIGETASGVHQAAVGVVDVATTALGLGDINIATSQDDAIAAIDKINLAINTVATYRSQFGAMQNRLGWNSSSLGNTKENAQASESRIRDTDMAREMMKYTKNNILSQSSQSSLQHATQMPESVLGLLQ
ncbi:MAG: flagellin [Bacillota bacterium]